MGLEKLDMPIKSRDRATWDEYCRGDVMVIVKAMQAYWVMVYEWQLGNFAYTLAGQGFAAFRHRFMETPIFIDDNKEAAELSRAGYVGARMECFRIGEISETVHCLDINSQYPFIMATTPVPTKLVTTLTRTTLTELKEVLQTYCIVADVSLTTTEPLYPKKVPGWTIFPIGQFRTVLNSPELSLALEAGVVTHVNRAIVYARDVIFKEYVNFFYEKRMEARVKGDETLERLCKLMLNTLYGKFGQNGRKYETLYKTSDPATKTWIEWDSDGRTLHRYRQFNGVVEELRIESESRESFPAIAGHITSAARVLLADYIAQAGQGNTLYCDTDSLFVNDAGLRNLSGRISQNQLGWMKHEWSSNDLIIYGAKDYQVGSKLKRKGIRANAEMVGVASFQQDQFRGLKGMVRDGDLDRMIVRRVTKHLSRVYSKGTVDLDGVVHPLIFPHPDYPDQ